MIQQSANNHADLVLVAGWSDNGWLSGGHAVRMAIELCKQSKFLVPTES